MTRPSSGIAQVHADDVLVAQRIIQEAIRKAGAQWLPIDVIADALALELIAAWTRCRPTEALPAHLAEMLGQHSALRSRHRLYDMVILKERIT